MTGPLYALGLTRVVSPLSAAGRSQLTSDGNIGYISLNLKDSSSALSTTDANAIVATANPAKAAGVEVAAGGYLGQEVSKPSTGTSAVVGLIAAVLILLLTLGSAIAMGMPLITALLGLGAGLALITLLGHVVEVPTVAPALATMIGLGVGIDYGLFVVTPSRSPSPGRGAVAATARRAGSAGPGSSSGIQPDRSWPAWRSWPSWPLRYGCFTSARPTPVPSPPAPRRASPTTS
jgi:putative drug exporter of the RND superfamily